MGIRSFAYQFNVSAFFEVLLGNMQARSLCLIAGESGSGGGGGYLIVSAAEAVLFFFSETRTRLFERCCGVLA